MIYGAVNRAVLDAVPVQARRVLDVGCGTGSLGVAIKNRGECYVAGITHSPDEAALAERRLDTVLVRDLESGLGDLADAETEPFDLVICSHVLEHVSDPAALLRMLAGHISPAGQLIAALPNVLHWRQRLEFLLGRFRYTDGGLMDRTHLRFFDWSSARELLETSGYRVVAMKACGTFPASRFMWRFGPVLDRVAVRTCPGLFGTQFLLVCHPTGREGPASR